ncbi:hypothetical protein [Streptomyces sp. NPDC005009]
MLFSFVMTVEADNPAAFPGRQDDDGAFGALLCAGTAAVPAAVAVPALSRRPLAKAVCAAVVLVCVHRVIGVAGQFRGRPLRPRPRPRRTGTGQVTRPRR